MSESDSQVKNTKHNTIVRIVHNRENPFVQLNKKTLWDPNLSMKAVGLWAKCLSRPDNWTFSITELVSKCKEGRAAVDSAMNELIEAGYVIRLEHTQTNKEGKFCGRKLEYVFFEFPASPEEKEQQLEIFKKFHRDCGFRDLGFPNLGKSQLLIKRVKDKEAKDKKNTTSNSSNPPTEESPKPQPKKKAESGGIFFSHEEKKFKNITQDFIDLMKATYPGIDVDKELLKMTAWLLDPGNPRRDGKQAFITKWLSKAEPTPQSTPPKESHEFNPEPQNDADRSFYDAIKRRDEQVKKNQKDSK